MLYFAYGSNLCKTQMEMRCPGAIPVGPSILENHRLTFRTYKPEKLSPSFCNVEYSEGEKVYGALWDIDPFHMRVLDHYETVPKHYRKHYILSGDKSALLYQMNPVNIGREALPMDRYLTIVAQGYKDFDLPLSYLGATLSKLKNNP